MDTGTSGARKEKKGDQVVKKHIYIFELLDGRFRGIEAETEEEATEIAEDVKGWEIKRLARTEPVIIKGGSGE